MSYVYIKWRSRYTNSIYFSQCNTQCGRKQLKALSAPLRIEDSTLGDCTLPVSPLFYLMTLSNSHEFSLVLCKAVASLLCADFAQTRSLARKSALRALNKKQEDRRLQSRVTKTNDRIFCWKQTGQKVTNYYRKSKENLRICDRFRSVALGRNDLQILK